MQVLVSDSPTAHAAALPAALPACVAHKFGGTSLADAPCLRQVATLLRRRPEQSQAIVVSAMRGVTDALLGLGLSAARREIGWKQALESLRERHLLVAGELLGAHASETLGWLGEQFDELETLLGALSVLGVPAREALERIQGLGEVFSAQLLSTHLRELGEPVACLDAREVLLVRRGEMGVVVDWQQSARRLAAWRQANPQPRVVITGFIASDDDGHATILGRNGSDFSGAIFAALFEASELHIWTDVDGILSADPRLVPEAVSLPSLSYHEAFELAYFGAKVIHPQTLTPVLERGVPVIIRNTFNPEFAGTRIVGSSHAEHPVKALTLCPDLALLNVEGAAMIGVPGTAQRVFDALRRADVSVVMISQGSSEQSICCVVRAPEASRAEQALQQAFEPELQRGQIQSITLRLDISVLAAVGDGMAGTPGVAARLFGALAHARVNVGGLPRARRSGTYPWPWPVAMRRGPCAPRTPASGCRRRPFPSAWSDRARSARRCCGNCAKRCRACVAKRSSTCACARSPIAGTCGWMSWARTPPTGSNTYPTRSSPAISKPSPRTCAPSICRTRSSSIAAPATPSRRATPAGWRRASMSSRRTSTPAPDRSSATRPSAPRAWLPAPASDTRPLWAPACR